MSDEKTIPTTRIDIRDEIDSRINSITPIELSKKLKGAKLPFRKVDFAFNNSALLKVFRLANTDRNHIVIELSAISGNKRLSEDQIFMHAQDIKEFIFNDGWRFVTECYFDYDQTTRVFCLLIRKNKTS